MKFSLLIAVLLCAFGFFCHNDDMEDGGPDVLVIKTGQECGWCGGRDSLIITELKIDYNFTNPCDSEKNKTRKSNTNREKWNELLESFNWNDFTQVNVNTCSVCVDGCDTWISIQNGGLVHQIRFTENSPKIEPSELSSKNWML